MPHVRITVHTLFSGQRLSFTFNLWFLYELEHKVCLSKTACGIFYFQLRLVFIIVYYFCLTKCLDSLTFWKLKQWKSHTQFCSQTFDFEVATRSFKTQWYLRELELPKIDLVTNFLNPENRSFENVSMVVNISHSFT